VDNFERSEHHASGIVHYHAHHLSLISLLNLSVKWQRVWWFVLFGLSEIAKSGVGSSCRENHAGKGWQNWFDSYNRSSLVLPKTDRTSVEI
jgi:hypothetical protein